MTDITGPDRLDPDDPATAARVRSQRRKVLLIAGGGGAVAAAIALFFLRPFLRDQGDLETGWEPSGALRVLAFVLIVAGVGLAATVVVATVRSGQARRNRRSALWAIPWSQRRALTRQVMANTVAAGTDPATLRLTATSMRDARGLILMLVGLLVAITGGTLLNPSPFQLVISGLLVASWATLCIATARQVRRAEVFLRDHPS